MKKITYILFIVLFIIIGCEDFLERSPEADISTGDVFGTYQDYQGYVDKLYTHIIPTENFSLTTTGNLGQHVHAQQSHAKAYAATIGDYWEVVTSPADVPGLQTNIARENVNNDSKGGIWYDGWWGIREANIAIANIGLLVKATNEERNLILGQAFFFRAFFHYEIVRRMGGMPYIDKVLTPNDDLRIPRLNYQESTDKIVADFAEAANLLPVSWENTTVGKQFGNNQEGRPTKGAAYAMMAEALLYAGSPTMNLESTGSLAYNGDYMKRAAEAALEVIKLANQGVYSLAVLDPDNERDEYRRLFARIDGTVPYGTEIIFSTINSRTGNSLAQYRLGRLYMPKYMVGQGANPIVSTPTYNLISQYEVLSPGTQGLPPTSGTDKYEVFPGSGFDLNNPWKNRDPRMRKAIMLDGDTIWKNPALTTNPADARLYDGGFTRTQDGVLLSFICNKYYPKGVNEFDQEWGQFRYDAPKMRLADVYLIYAEAVYQYLGSSTQALAGSSLSALGAVNIVRQRALMPVKTLPLTGYVGADAEKTGLETYDKGDGFMNLLQNEREVELCFEAKNWYDIRRWHVGHLNLPKYNAIWDLKFLRADDYPVNQVKDAVVTKVIDRVFEDPRHYWLPIPTEQTQIYIGFGQNPGW